MQYLYNCNGWFLGVHKIYPTPPTTTNAWIGIKPHWFTTSNTFLENNPLLKLLNSGSGILDSLPCYRTMSSSGSGKVKQGTIIFWWWMFLPLFWRVPCFVFKGQTRKTMFTSRYVWLPMTHSCFLRQYKCIIIIIWTVFIIYNSYCDIVRNKRVLILNAYLSAHFSSCLQIGVKYAIHGAPTPSPPPIQRTSGE